MKFIKVGTLVLLTSFSLGCVGVASEEGGRDVVAGQCELPRKGQVSGSVSLESGCVYSGPITITQSDTQLSCNGAVIDGGGRQKNGIIINGKGKPINNVVVKDCVVRNFSGRGVWVTAGVKNPNWSTVVEENYKISPRNIVLDHLVIENIGRGGVYFDSYVTDSVLKNSTVRGSGRVGVYLEQATQRIKVLNNTIAHNGRSEKLKGAREGLAIDSSAKNIIEGNKFIGNAAGGVYLYKNCGEKFSTGKSLIRWQHSDQNTIRNNFFQNEPVGIWVASRQSKDLSKWDCGDPALDSAGKYFRDYANNNTLESNKFCNVRTGIRLEGNNNIVINNSSNSQANNWIDEPFKAHTLVGGGNSVGNRMSGNVVADCNGSR